MSAIDLPNCVSEAEPTSFPREEGTHVNEQYTTGSRLAAVFTALLLSVFLVALDQSIVATAIPRIVSDFDALSQVTWIASAYFLTQAGLFLPFGQFLTISPTKYVYLFAIFLFELGSLLCGVASSMEVLIVGRAVSGCGAAGIFISVFVIIAEIAPLESRSLLLGSMGGVFGLSSVAGPLLGGAFTDHVSWRWCFYINLPIGAVSIISIVLLLKARTPVGQGNHSEKSLLQKWIGLDWVGVVLILGTSTALLLALQWGGNVRPWDHPTVIACFVVSGVLLVGLLIWEHRMGDNAVLVLESFRNRTLVGASLEAFWIFGCQLLGVYYLPLWYQATKGHTATRSGLDILPFMLSVVIAAALSGVIINKTGRYWIFLAVAPLFTAVGSGLLYTLDIDTPAGKLIGFQIMFGVGIGATLQNLFVAVQAEFAKNPASIPRATSIVSFAQLLGGIVAIAAAGTIFGNQLKTNITKFAPDLPPGAAEEVQRSVLAIAELPEVVRGGVLRAYLHSLDPVFLIAVPCGVFAAVSSLLIRNHDLKDRSKVAAEIHLS